MQTHLPQISTSIMLNLIRLPHITTPMHMIKEAGTKMNVDKSDKKLQGNIEAIILKEE
ncbi:MAG: hypothetical protein NT010_10270 [Proteobacteria bacterium]|nr:hypothetical protein [Pseudomonadota bacterium]